MNKHFLERKPLSFTQMCARDIVPANTYALSNLLEDANLTLSAFSMDRYPVTVARYTQFIDEGGYFDADCWSEAGWHWRVQNNIMAPRFCF